MRRYVLGQIVQLVVVLVGVVSITFVVLRLSGDPLVTLLPPDASEEQRRILSEQLGLDRPIPLQYVSFMAHVARADFGRSIISGLPALGLVMEQLGPTVTLALLGMSFSAVVGVAGGIAAAVERDRWPDRLVTVIAVAGQATPVYWLALILIIVFAVQLDLLPASGMEGWRSWVLPAFSLSLALLPYVLRVTRSTMLDVLRSDYIRLHRAKGLTARSVLFRHALRNCLGPVITLLGLQAGVLMAGVVAIEFIYGRSGMGSLLLHSIYARDYPVVQAAVFSVALVVVVANFAADVAVAVIDPRVRLGARAA